MYMELKVVELKIPEDCNIIVGQSHFIKSVEDIYEAMVNSVPGIKFGLAFCEASGKRLVRVEGTDEELKKAAVENASAIGAGHSFVLLMRDAYPINVLNALKQVVEVVSIYCATANPVKVIVADLGEQRAILGVADGFTPKGVESEGDVAERKEFLRKIGYKR
ncbi:MAG TPA: adenosine monophosphate-protein transferase [Candidatus Methanomethylia archaeon]|nr:adenosine monophosphate-protein transferase [Candidatus Methanomethylicia archaeon]